MAQLVAEKLRWQLDETRKGEQLNKVETHESSPMAQGFKFPLLILRNHAPSQFSCTEHSWLGYLIKMCVYMMPQFNICHMS